MDLGARSRRSNLIFHGLIETTDENCDDVLRKFVKNELTLDLEDNAVTALVVQRVHRLGRPAPGRTRPLIAAFRDTTDIETLMKTGRNKLTNTNFRISRDLPDKIRQARGRFWPQLQQAKTDDKTVARTNGLSTVLAGTQT